MGWAVVMGAGQEEALSTRLLSNTPATARVGFAGMGRRRELNWVERRGLKRLGQLLSAAG
jgi:hypothetical protein